MILQKQYENNNNNNNNNNNEITLSAQKNPIDKEGSTLYTLIAKGERRN
jgi:hypothetical protein